MVSTSQSNLYSNPDCDHKFKGKNRLKLSDREYICPKCGITT